MRYILTFIIAALMQTGGVKVEGIVEFDKVVHDFGDFLLSGGPKSCEYKVRNISGKPIAILTVSPSCGCTDVEWTKAPIKPGETGTISATYDNKQGAYPFEKTLTVYISSLSKPVILRLRGNVLEEEKPLSQTYPVHIGKLGLRETEFKLGNINQGSSRSDFTLVANLGSKPLKVVFQDVTDGLEIKTDPETIDPGKTGRLVYTVHSDLGRWGKNWYYATPVANGVKGGPIGIWAFTKEDFGSWTKEQRDSASQPMADASTVNVGIIKAGEKISAAYNITNKGKSKLIVYKADSDTPGAEAEALPQLEPGAKGTFKVNVDTSSLPKGEFVIIITLTTNSYLRPIMNLFISGAIK